MNNKKITLTQLEQYLSKAAFILKVPVDALYIFQQLFFKPISDVYDEEYRIALEALRDKAEKGLISSIEFVKKLCKLAKDAIQAEKELADAVQEKTSKAPPRRAILRT